jgi:anti-anti-sigma factor
VDEPGDDRRRVAVWPYACVDVFVRNGTLRVRIEGEVDIANVARVEQTALEALASARPRALVLDLEPLEYLDGAGRAWIHRLGERLAVAGIDLEIRRPRGGAAARVFDLVWPVRETPAAVELGE